jgi:hypothetical protein
LDPVSAVKSVPIANRAQMPIAAHESGEAKRKYAAIEPHREKEKRTESSRLIQASGVELPDQKAEQPLLRIGNALSEGLEIYHGERFGARLCDVREAIHVTWTKYEVLTQNEVRVWLAAGSRGTG